MWRPSHHRTKPPAVILTEKPLAKFRENLFDGGRPSLWHGRGLRQHQVSLFLFLARAPGGVGPIPPPAPKGWFPPVEIQVRNRCKSNIITTHRLKKITNNVLKLVLDDKGRTNAEVSVVFCDDGYMRTLNNQHRGVNKSTDVLAFPMNEGRFAAINPDMLGDIVISVPKSREQALAHEHSMERELTILLIHGLLHLLGYDHMNDKDEAAMKEQEMEFLMLVEEELSLA